MLQKQQKLLVQGFTQASKHSPKCTTKRTILHYIVFQPVILCGDFNLPHIDWDTTSPSARTPAASMLCDIVSDCFLVQLVSASTRQDSILDLVLTNIPDDIFSVTVCDNIPGTDHDAVKFVIAAAMCPKVTPP